MDEAGARYGPGSPLEGQTPRLLGIAHPTLPDSAKQPGWCDSLAYAIQADEPAGGSAGRDRGGSAGELHAGGGRWGARLKPPPTVATIGGGSRGRRHAAGRISPSGGVPSGTGFGVPFLGAASTLLALSHVASSSASLRKR